MQTKLGFKFWHIRLEISLFGHWYNYFLALFLLPSIPGSPLHERWLITFIHHIKKACFPFPISMYLVDKCWISSEQILKMILNKSLKWFVQFWYSILWELSNYVLVQGQARCLKVSVYFQTLPLHTYQSLCSVLPHKNNIFIY